MTTKVENSFYGLRHDLVGVQSTLLAAVTLKAFGTSSESRGKANKCPKCHFAAYSINFTNILRIVFWQFAFDKKYRKAVKLFNFLTKSCSRNVDKIESYQCECDEQLFCTHIFCTLTSIPSTFMKIVLIRTTKNTKFLCQKLSIILLA